MVYNCYLQLLLRRKMSKRKQGHWCWVCRRYRANEKFTGKGHAKHICQDCAQRQKRLKKFQQKENLKDKLGNIQRNLSEKLKDNLKCLILYGSWAKGMATEASDIDLIVVLEKVDADIRKFLYECEMEGCADIERHITFLSVSIEDFRKENIPLYTAVKREGKIIWGNIDLTINPDTPHIKYAEFFKRSKEFEVQKIKIAEDILSKHPGYGSAELCFVASKHAIQAVLAMKGIGYSSKVKVLLPLTKEHLGEDIAKAFKKLLDLYTKSEYGVEFLTDEESRLAIEYAKKVLEVYNMESRYYDDEIGFNYKTPSGVIII